jgi:hypothetical protein
MDIARSACANHGFSMLTCQTFCFSQYLFCFPFPVFWKCLKFSDHDSGGFLGSGVSPVRFAFPWLSLVGFLSLYLYWCRTILIILWFGQYSVYRYSYASESRDACKQKVRIFKEYHSVCTLVGIETLSPASVHLPP